MEAKPYESETNPIPKLRWKAHRKIHMVVPPYLNRLMLSSIRLFA